MSTLSSLLVQREVATMRAVEDAIGRQVLHGGDLATNLLENRAVQEEAVTRVLADWYGVEPAPAGMLPTPEPEALRVLPAEVAERHSMCPLHLMGDTLVVATSEPLSAEVERELRASLGVRFRQLVAPVVRVRQALAANYGAPLDRRTARLIAKLDGLPEPPPIRLAVREAPPRARPEPPAATPSPRPIGSLPRLDSVAVAKLEGIESARSPGQGGLASPAVEVMALAAASRRDPRAETGGGAELREAAARPSSDRQVAREEASARPVSDRSTAREEPRERPLSVRSPAREEARTRPESTRAVVREEPRAAPESVRAPAREEPRVRPESVRAPAREEPRVRPESVRPPAREEPRARPESVRPPAREEPRPRPESARPEEAFSPAPEALRGSTLPGASGAPLAWLRRVEKREQKDQIRRVRRKGPFTVALAEEELSGATSTESVLDTLLHFASQFFDYAVLFTVHGELAEGHDSVGQGADRAHLATILVPLDVPGVLSLARARGVPVIAVLGTSGADAELLHETKREAAGPSERKVAVLPISVRGRPVALLYGDDGVSPADLGSIGDLVALCGLVAAALERILVSRKRERGAATVAARVPPPARPTVPGNSLKATSAAREAFKRALTPPPGVHGPETVSAADPTTAPPTELTPAPHAPRKLTPRPAGAFKEAVHARPAPDFVRRETVRGFGDARQWAPGRKIEDEVTAEMLAVPSSKPEARAASNRPRSPSVKQTLPFPGDSLAMLARDQGVSPSDIPPPSATERSRVSERPPGREADAASQGPSGRPSARPASASGSRSRPEGLMPPAPPARVLGRTVRGLGQFESKPPEAGDDTPSVDEKVIDALLERLLGGGAGSQAAFGELVKCGEQAMPAIMACFPGPVPVSREGASPDLLSASQCGPILGMVVALRRPALSFVIQRSAGTEAEGRFWATHALGEMLYPEAASAILPRLFDEDAAVRDIARRSAEALLGAGAPGLPLLHGLERRAREATEPLGRRVQAVDAMASIRVRSLVPLLIGALGDDAEVVREAAQQGLLKATFQDFGREAEPWTRWWKENRNRHRVEWIIDALGHASAPVRSAASRELESITTARFGYDPALPEDDRASAQRDYRAWWDREGRALLE